MKQLIILILLALLPADTWGAAITTAQAGNWSATSTWTGGVVPSNGDTATIAHAVTVDQNAIIGTSPAAGTAVLTVNSGISFTVAENVSLTVRGDFYLSGPFVMGAGSTLEFDSSLSASPSTTSYEWRYAVAGSTTTITINGAANNRCTIRSNAGGKNAFVNSTTTNFQKWTETNCDWYRFGGSGTYSIYFRMYGYGASKGFDISGSTYDSFDKQMYILANNANDAQTNISFDRIWTRNSSVSAIIGMNVTEGTTGQRKLTNSYFDGQIVFPTSSGIGAWDISGSVFTKINANAPSSLKTASGAAGCTLIDMVGTTGPINLGTLNDVAFTEALVITHVAATTHQEGIINGSKFSLDGVVWEGSGQEPEAPILTSSTVNTTSAAYDLSVKNALVLPNPAGSGLGMIVEMKGSKYTRVVFENVTAAIGSSDYEWGLIKSSWGSNSRGFAGHLASIRNNLLWNPSGNDADNAFIIDNVRTEAVRSGTAGASSTTTVLYSNQLLTGVSSGEGSYYVKMTSGPDSGLIRAVTANDATTVTVGTAFPNSMANYTYELFPLDQVTAADYNAIFGVEADGTLYDSSNASARTNVKGYTGLAQTDTAAIGAHDVDLPDLQFFDPSRNIYRWATADSGLNRATSTSWADTTAYVIGDAVSRGVSGFYGGDVLNYRCIKPHTSSSADAPGGWAAANWRTYWIPEGLYLIIQNKLQRTGYLDSASQAAYMQWVREGWAPNRMELIDRGYNGAHIGAVRPHLWGAPAMMGF